MANCETDEERRRTDEIIRPILRGRDIKKYGYHWGNLWLIATFPSRNYDIEAFPAIKKYLLSFAKELLIDNGYQWVAENYLSEYCYKRLEQSGEKIHIDGKLISFSKNERARKKTNNKWFELQDNINYWDLLHQPKIIWGEISDKSKFCIDVNGKYYPEATTFMLSGDNLYFLLAFLNCTVSEYIFSKIGTTTGVGTVRWKKYKIFDLFVPIKLTDFQKDKIICFCKEIVLLRQKSIDASALENQLNQYIYDIYNLTNEEIEFIERLLL